MYESQVTFIFDIICPWTYLAKLRLDKALATVDTTEVTFRASYTPYILQPDLPASVDRREWLLQHKYMDNSLAQAAFEERMGTLFNNEGVDVHYEGMTGDTTPAHRVIQTMQRDRGSETAGKIIDSLYKRYWTLGQHPGEEDTILGACMDAGVPEQDAQGVIRDPSMGESELKRTLQQVNRDIEAVPVVVIEGKRRDLTLTGAKEVKDYVKAFEQIIKESR